MFVSENSGYSLHKKCTGITGSKRFSAGGKFDVEPISYLRIFSGKMRMIQRNHREFSDNFLIQVVGTIVNLLTIFLFKLSKKFLIEITMSFDLLNIVTVVYESAISAVSLIKSK